MIVNLHLALVERPGAYKCGSRLRAEQSLVGWISDARSVIHHKAVTFSKIGGLRSWRR